MSYNPDTRQKALDAALQSMGGTAYDINELLKTARTIEAYLNGTDAPRTGSGNTQGGINPLGNLQAGVNRSNLAGGQLGGTTQ